MGLLGNEKGFRMLKKDKSKALWETRENKLVDKIAEVFANWKNDGRFGGEYGSLGVMAPSLLFRETSWEET